MWLAGNLSNLALLLKDGQLDTAEELAIRAIDLTPEGEQHKLCQGHRVLCDVYRSKGETEEATHHFEVALEIAVSLNTSHDLAGTFTDEDRFSDTRSKRHIPSSSCIVAAGLVLDFGSSNMRCSSRGIARSGCVREVWCHR